MYFWNQLHCALYTTNYYLPWLQCRDALLCMWSCVFQPDVCGVMVSNYPHHFVMSGSPQDQILTLVFWGTCSFANPDPVIWFGFWFVTFCDQLTLKNFYSVQLQLQHQLNFCTCFKFVTFLAVLHDIKKVVCDSFFNHPFPTLYFICLSSDWFVTLFTFIVIGQNKSLDFGFPTHVRK